MNHRKLIRVICDLLSAHLNHPDIVIRKTNLRSTVRKCVNYLNWDLQT